MATYKATLKASMKAYPRLFLNELDFMGHAFFVLGNGLRWENGQLTEGRSLKEMITEAERNREHTKKQKLAEKERLLKIQDTMDPEEFEFLMHDCSHEYDAGTIEENRKKEIEFREEIISEYEDDEGGCWYKTSDGTIGQKIYPISQFCKIMNLPDDIKPDWLAAVEKAIALCYTERYKLTENDWKCIKEVVEPRIKQLKENNA